MATQKGAAAGSSKPEAEVVTRRVEEVAEEPVASEILPVGGRLAYFKNKWAFNSWAHSIVSKGLGWAWLDRPPHPKRFFQEETPLLKDYVQDLLSKAVIRKAKSLKFQGRLFCVPKRNSDKK